MVLQTSSGVNLRLSVLSSMVTVVVTVNVLEGVKSCSIISPRPGGRGVVGQGAISQCSLQGQMWCGNFMVTKHECTFGHNSFEAGGDSCKSSSIGMFK